MQTVKLKAMESVSIIVPSYKDGRERFDMAIRSILAQKGVNVHLILSTVKGDDCLKWIKKHSGDIDVVTMDDHGKKDPTNSFKQIIKAIQKIKHRWTTFCSANDPLMLDKCFNETAILKRTGKLVCYSARLDADENGNVVREVQFPPYNFNKHLESNFVYDGSMVYTPLFMKYMPFRIKWYNCGYWDLWLRIFKGEGNVFAYNPRPVKKYIISADSMHQMREKNVKNKKRHLKDRDAMLKSHR